MRRIHILLAAAAAVLPLSARAEMLPAYDPLTICESVAGSSARQEMIMRGCLFFQERMRKEVALVWDKVPSPVQQSCAATAKASGDYWRLKSCLDREAPAATPSFNAAADEAALSRLLGGIHFRAAIENGLTQGRCIAQYTIALRTRS